jgi:hypothetical protein
MFFKVTVDLTDTTFTEDDLHLLDKGLKYNLHKNPKIWTITLAIEADTAVRALPRKTKLINNIQKLINEQNRKK